MSFKNAKYHQHFGTVLMVTLIVLLAIHLTISFIVGHTTPESDLIEEIFLYLFLVMGIYMLLGIRQRRKWGEENYRYFMVVYRLMKQHDKEEVTPEQIITELKELVS